MTDLQRAAIRNGHLAYLDVGDGAPLVLLHGGALDHRMWNRQIGPFANKFRVIAPDLRGHGMSSTPTGAFRHCDDIKELMDHLGIDRAIIVGLSLGGSTAVDVAIEYDDAVTALVVGGTGSSEPDWSDPWMLEMLATWQRNAADRDAQAWVETFLRIGNGPHRTLDELQADVLEDLREQACSTLAAHVSGGAPVMPGAVPDARRRARDINVPVLAVSGALDSEDHIRMAVELAEGVRDGSKVMITDAAHYPNMEQPEQFNCAVLAFLSQRTLDLRQIQPPLQRHVVTRPRSRLLKW